MAGRLGVSCHTVNIEKPFSAFAEILSPLFKKSTCGHDRRKYPGALPRIVAYGRIQQNRQAGFDDGQQK